MDPASEDRVLTSDADLAPDREIVPAAELRAFAATLFEASGMMPQDAEQFAEELVWADLRGISPHGVTKIPLDHVRGVIRDGPAGVLYAHLLGAFSAQQFYLGLTITTLAMLIVGGMSTVSGAIVGTIVLYAASEALREVEASAGLFGLSQIIIALILLLMMYFRPQGLAGRFEVAERWTIARTRRRLDDLRGSAAEPAEAEQAAP